MRVFLSMLKNNLTFNFAIEENHFYYYSTIVPNKQIYLFKKVYRKGRKTQVKKYKISKDDLPRRKVKNFLSIRDTAVACETMLGLPHARRLAVKIRKTFGE